jgi:hypothetical protein
VLVVLLLVVKHQIQVREVPVAATVVLTLAMAAASAEAAVAVVEPVVDLVQAALFALFGQVLQSGLFWRVVGQLQE